MGRPKGSRNRKTAVPAMEENGHSMNAVLDQGRPFDLVLGMRKTFDFGPLLWELTELRVDPRYTVVKRILTDANIKRFVITEAAKALTRCL